MRLAAIFVLLVHTVLAQSPQVPHKLNFAGITLTIRDDARREIQKDVDALTQYPKYFNIKVERAKTYFPIIEKIFQEERLPDDFKYLVIQESALIPDAVSVSNAVGFWQFKDFTAIEMGLRVDKEIDERMNIASSSRAAAQYLKKNNTFFNNWVYALQAYQMGAGAVMRSTNDYESGAKHMEITSKTYWYVKKFLAHKIAFEGAVSGAGETRILAYENRGRKTIHDISKELAVPADDLLAYNKWIKKEIVPDDRAYVVAIPVQGSVKNISATIAKANAENLKQESGKKVDAKPALAIQSDKRSINGLPAIRAVAGENAAALSKRAGVGLSYFLTCNDLSISDPLTEGQYYYLRKKRAKVKGTQSGQHIVALNTESLWSISQQYGIQLKRLEKLNPGLSTGKLKPGEIVALSSTPVSAAREISEPLIVAEVETGDYFNWSVSSKPEKEEMVAYSNTAIISLADTMKANETQIPEEIRVKSVEGTVTIDEPQRKEARPEVHTVSQGETLYFIAKKYNVGVMDLVNWNNLNLGEGIKPGQQIKLLDESMVQVTSEVASKFIVYEVKASDTLYSVARQYGVTIKDIMDWNNKKDFNVTTGEKLKIQQ